jgi:hypothetical protein
MPFINPTPTSMEDTRPIRPLGVSILSWLDIIAGAGGAIAVLLMIFHRTAPRVQEFFAATGISPSLTILYILLICSLALISGIGMWTGRRWAWYLGSFIWLYSIIRSLNALVNIALPLVTTQASETAQSSHGPVYYFAKFGLRVFFQILIYTYFFQPNVRSYFGVSETQKWRVFLPQLGIALGIIIVTTLVMNAI